ncbi:MAG: DUF92 domain-containing protein [Candidatus Bathyarchaeota archaeon]|nr:DUF92 domain-containing protein [Candidatus Bathyarchaeota archaeon]
MIVLAMLLIGCLLFSAIVYVTQFFDLGGAVATFLFLMIVMARSPPWWSFVLVAMYVTILGATIYKKNDKARIRGAQFAEESKKRTYTNVIGKIALPAIAAILGDTGMFISSTSFGVADSFANEIGILSRRRPLLITTGESVDPGTNGAVSPLGTFACIISSVSIGLMIPLLSFFECPWIPCLILGLVTGVLGSFIDSLMGATLENQGVLRGWQINFFSGLVIGVIGSYIYPIFYMLFH